jgi:hypothetical protein
MARLLSYSTKQLLQEVQHWLNTLQNEHVEPAREIVRQINSRLENGLPVEVQLGQGLDIKLDNLACVLSELFHKVGREFDDTQTEPSPDGECLANSCSPNSPKDLC